MPTYEYKCETCGHHFEKFQRMSDASVEICPECGGQVRRLPGAGAGVIFKGSRFSEPVHTRSTQCGREQTCCGRDERCARPPCHD